MTEAQKICLIVNLCFSKTYSKAQTLLLSKTVNRRKCVDVRKTRKIKEENEMKNGLNSVAELVRNAATKKLEACFGNQTLVNLKTKMRVAVRAAAPIFGAILFNLLLHEAAHAQGGGPIFSGNSGNLANIIREGLKLFAILLFCGGALGIGAAIWNKMWGKEWGNYAIGGGAAFAFGTIVAVIYSISQGQNVSVDTNF